MISLQPAAHDESLQANMVCASEPGRLVEVRRQTRYILERPVLLNQNQCTQDVLSTSFDNSMTLGGCR